MILNITSMIVTENKPKILSEMLNKDWKFCIESVFYKINSTYTKLGKDELMSAANVGVGIATTKFDPKKCPQSLIPFLIYKGYYCAIDQIRIDWKTRSISPTRKHSPFDEVAYPYGPQENYDSSGNDFISLDPPHVIDINNPDKIVFNDIIKDIPEWEQNILIAYFIDNISMNEMGKNFISYAGHTYVHPIKNMKNSVSATTMLWKLNKILNNLRKKMILKYYLNDIPIDINKSQIKRIHKMITSSPN